MLESSHKMRDLLILVLFSLVPSQSYGEMVEVIDYQEQTLNQLVHSRDTQYFRADGELIIFNLTEYIEFYTIINSLLWTALILNPLTLSYWLSYILWSNQSSELRNEKRFTHGFASFLKNILNVISHVYIHIARF